MTDSTTTDVFALSIPHEAWRAAGDPAEPEEERTADERSLLTAVVTINGTFHHLVAYEVTVGDDGMVTPSDGDKSEEIDGYYAAAGALGSFETTTIAGREYIVVMTPFESGERRARRGLLACSARPRLERLARSALGLVCWSWPEHGSPTWPVPEIYR